MEEQIQNSVNLEIPSRWRRFSAYLLDLIINFTIIGFIINTIIIFSMRTTLGNIIIGIKSLNENNDSLTLWQTILRYIIFYSTFPFLFFQLSFLGFGVELINNNVYAPCLGNDCSSSIDVLFRTSFILCTTINIIELFFNCPTFIDKRLGIKRLYKKSK